MYSDPTKIRSHVVKLRFSDEEDRLITALADYTGEQKATLLRELVLDAAASSLQPDVTDRQQAFEGSFASLRCAG